jgi:hypothetical protein
MATSSRFSALYEGFTDREKIMFHIWMDHFNAVATVTKLKDMSWDQWSAEAIANVVANKRLPT